MEVIISILIIVLFIRISNAYKDVDMLKNQLRIYEKENEHKFKSLTKRIENLEKEEDKISKEQVINNIEHIFVQQKIPENAEVKHIEPVKNAAHSSVEENNKFTKRQSAPEEKQFDIENIFLGNIFSKIGGIILVIAICFLVRLSSKFIEFTPQLNISLGYLVSLSFMGSSIYFFKKERNVLPEILSGVSIAGLLLSTYFGCYFYSLFPTSAALFICFLIAISSYAVSTKYNSFSTIAIALFGGYLNPAVFSGINIGVFFAYLIALNLISLAYTFTNGNKNRVNCANIFLSTIALAIFASKTQSSVFVVYPIILWLLYIGYDILTSLSKTHQDRPEILRWFNFAALVYITNHIFKFTELLPIGLTILGTGIVYSLISYVMNKKNDDISLMSLQSSLLCLLFTSFYLVKAPYLGLAWAIEGFLVCELYLKLNNEKLSNYPLIFFVPSMIYLLINNQIMFSQNSKYNSVLVCLIYFVQALSMIYSAQRLKNRNTFLSTNVKMLGFSTIYLYLAFYFNTKETFKHSKLYIDAIITALYSFHSQKLLSKNYKDFAKIFAYSFFFLGILTLILAEIITIKGLGFVPFLNIKFSAYLTLIALSIYLGKGNDKFNYLAIVLGMFSLVGQVKCIFNNLLPADTMEIVITTCLIIYSGIILTIGILKNIKSMKKTSICLILLLLTKLILLDLYNIDALFKLISFVIVGFILLGVSSYYQKIQK